MIPLVSDEQIIRVLKKYEGEHMPVRRLKDLLGYDSTSTVHDRLKKLESKGLIRIEVVRETYVKVLKEEGK
ncbi:HTH domain-containing protein [Proteiniborus sp.]|uniref:LexA family protein n=1 Tax=Proteiniborus sp. TaxID=2079015 RepID=UPI0033188A4F